MMLVALTICVVCMHLGVYLLSLREPYVMYIIVWSIIYARMSEGCKVHVYNKMIT